MAKNGNIHPKRIFKTESDMQKAWDDYKESRLGQSKNWEKVQYVGKDGNRVIDYPVLPLTLEGFSGFCYDTGLGDIHQYFNNNGGYYNDFISICSRIRESIRDHQITGGMLGFFNPSITQRLNNLSEKVETNNKQDIIITSEDSKRDNDAISNLRE